ncbi:MAG TPA: S41 family peptidase [Terracidiphilus sp.]
MLRRLMLMVVVIGCAGPARTQPAVPSTPAGHVLGAWLEAFNSGDRAKIDAFLKTYAPRLEQAALTSAQFRGQSGGVNLVGITRNERYIVGFRVQEKAQPVFLYGRIEVTAAKTPTIQNFVIRAVPREAVLDEIKLDALTRKQTIESISIGLNQSYLFPEVAQKMADSLRAHEREGDYSEITDGDAFASLLSKHLVEVSHDKHLGVYYQPYKFNGQPSPLTLDQLTEDRKALARDCGFRNLDILANNIGYMKVDFFADPMACGRTAAAAMSFLANTDAVIFDLRDNGGGDPRMVALMCSYLFDRPVHLNDFYDRAANSTTEYWTPRYVPGTRLGQKPAYVLTSAHTFSGAEEFAYDLKNLKRVTVVGETTGGGAHVVSGQQAGDHFILYVPHGRSISPVTRTDWEGTGVTPDVQVSADDALATAERMAAERIQQNAARDGITAKTN